MNYAPLHGAPPPNRPASYGNQDARSNLAVQPAANPVKINLKKASVKVVRPAAATPSTTPLPPPPAPKPIVEAEPKVPPAQPQSSVTKEDAEATLDAMFARLSSSSPPKPQFSTAKIDAEVALDAMFARLNSASPTPSLYSPAASEKNSSIITPTGLRSDSNHTSNFPVEITAKNPSPISTVSTVARDKRDEAAEKMAVSGKAQGKRPAPNEQVVMVEKDQVRNMEKPVEEHERHYLKKASEYVSSLPTHEKAVTARLVQNVAIMLHRSHAPAGGLEPGAVESAKSRYVDAVATYCNGLCKPGAKHITAEFVKKALEEGDGHFLRLCATLVDEKLLVIENLNEIVGLCKAIMDALPAGEKHRTVSIELSKSVPKDAMDAVTAWPSQEKRENVAGCRTCILKGVSSITSINHLQALVWGGRLESLSLPTPGSSYALVKFLTAEACESYFAATANGLNIPGDSKTTISVEKQPGPNSTNDVIRNCIEGDASRCVRAVDADDEWSDVMLFKLARGSGHTKREVDRIKRGKNASGRYCIEFRFSNIYYALNFKRTLMDDEDWEHCTIGYAPDPCETARGVHFRDEDEVEQAGRIFT